MEISQNNDTEKKLTAAFLNKKATVPSSNLNVYTIKHSLLKEELGLITML